MGLLRRSIRKSFMTMLALTAANIVSHVNGSLTVKLPIGEPGFTQGGNRIILWNTDELEQFVVDFVAGLGYAATILSTTVEGGYASILFTVPELAYVAPEPETEVTATEGVTDEAPFDVPPAPARRSRRSRNLENITA